jgi:hypothetical protein
VLLAHEAGVVDRLFDDVVDVLRAALEDVKAKNRATDRFGADNPHVVWMGLLRVQRNVCTAVSRMRGE